MQGHDRLRLERTRRIEEELVKLPLYNFHFVNFCETLHRKPMFLIFPGKSKNVFFNYEQQLQTMNYHYTLEIQDTLTLQGRYALIEKILKFSQIYTDVYVPRYCHVHCKNVLFSFNHENATVV